MITSELLVKDDKNTMKKWLLCSLMLGCFQGPNSTRHYSLWIDPSFNDQQVKDICQVVSERQKQNTFDGFASDPDGANTVAVYASPASANQASKIYVDGRLDEGRFLQTTRKKLGHALGK